MMGQASKSVLLAGLMLVLSCLFTACGGGSGAGSSVATGDDATPPSNNDSEFDEPAQFQGVNGPLDAVQEPLSHQVFTSMRESVSGTALSSTFTCVEEVIVKDIVDVLDAVIVFMDEERDIKYQTTQSSALDDLRLSVAELQGDLPDLLASFVGQSDCTTINVDSGTKPLAGTPLAELGDALYPYFVENFDVKSMDLVTMSGYFSDLSGVYQQGVAGLSPELRDTVVLGGVLETLASTFSNLAYTLGGVALQDNAIVSSGVSLTLNDAMSGILVDVLPVKYLEIQTGVEGLFSYPINSAVSQLALEFESGLEEYLPPIFDGMATVLPAISQAIEEGVAGSSEPNQPTNTAIDIVLAPLDRIANSFPGAGGIPSGDGLTGSAIDILLTPLVSAIEIGGLANCPLVNTPLASVCNVVEDVLDSLN